MTLEEAKKLVPHKDKVLYGSVSVPFEFVRLHGETHLVIYDEPPSKHEDFVLISSCEKYVDVEKALNVKKYG